MNLVYLQKLNKYRGCWFKNLNLKSTAPVACGNSFLFPYHKFLGTLGYLFWDFLYLDSN